MGGGAWPFLVGGVICLVKKKMEFARDRCVDTHSNFFLKKKKRVCVDYDI